MAVQQQVCELMTTLHPELETSHTPVSKDSSEWGNVAKQSRGCSDPQLVCELDEAESWDFGGWSWRSTMFKKLRKPRGEKRERWIQSPPFHYVMSPADTFLPLTGAPDFPHLPPLEVSPSPCVPGTINMVIPLKKRIAVFVLIRNVGDLFHYFSCYP